MIAIIERCTQIHPTMHQTTLKSSYIKMGATENQWGETSWSQRSAWHDAIDEVDAPYMLAHLLRQQLQLSAEGKPSAFESCAKEDALDTRGSNSGVSKDGTDEQDVGHEDDKRPITKTFIENLAQQLEPEQDAPSPILGATTMKVASPTTALSTATVEVHSGALASGPHKSESNSGRREILPESPKMARQKKILAHYDEGTNQLRAAVDQLKALTAKDDIGGMIALLNEIVDQTNKDLALLTRNLFGHVPTASDLRNAGLPRMVELFKQHPDLISPVNDQDSDTSSDGGIEDFFNTEAPSSRSQEDDPDMIEPGEYTRLAGIGNLRHGENDDEMVWFAPDKQNTEIYSDLVRRTMYGRRICVTDIGLVGIVPTATEVGDTIVAFRGGRTPFIVRPQETGDASWRLVGDCYIHALMRGEAFLFEDAEERDFVLK